MMESIDSASVFGRMASVKALVIGDTLLDKYVLGRTERISREAPVPVLCQEDEEYRLGGAANVARNIAAMGATVELCSAFGSGEERDVIHRLAAASAIVLREGDKSLPVTLKTRFLAGAIGTAKQQVLRLDREAYLKEQDTGWVLDVVNTSAYDVVVLSDYGYGVIQPALLKRLSEIGNEKTVCCDSRYRLESFYGAHACTPNLPEAVALASRLGIEDQSDGKSGPNVRLFGERLRTRLGCRSLLITQGRDGMTLFEEGFVDHVSIVEPQGLNVTDVTGAGDTVLAVFAMSLAAGQSAADAMRIANAAAGVVVHKSGCATASPLEIGKWLHADL